MNVMEKLVPKAKRIRSTKRSAGNPKMENGSSVSEMTRNSKAKSPSRKRSEKTFENPELEASFVHFVQMSFPELRSHDELLKSSKRLSLLDIGVIGDLSVFQDAQAEGSLLGSTLLFAASTEPSKRTSKLLDLPIHLARLCETKLLTPTEEKQLFLRMNYLRFRAEQLKEKINPDKPEDWLIRRIDGLLKAADWHRDWIVKSNMRLVISIVKTFVNQHNGFDDLLSDGIVAIIRAVEKFDVQLGFRFSTYATQVVRRNTYRRVMEKQKERQRNTGSLSENGIDVSDDQKSSSMSEERWNLLRSRLTLMLDHLDRREKFIIRARFSLGGHRKVQTLQRLADVLGVSKERIRQLEKRALDKLRGMTAANPIPDSDIIMS